MASDNSSFVRRGLARIQQFFGLTSSSDLASTAPTPNETSIHYGMFSRDELRHMDGVVMSNGAPVGGNVPTEQDIITRLQDVAADTAKHMDDLKNIKLMAPEITLAKRIIVSSILSPQDLQTDKVNVSVDAVGVSDEVKNKINDLLSTYFNKEFDLGSRLVKWLGKAGFDEGATAIMVMPQNEIDVLNTVADAWAPGDKAVFKQGKAVAASEGLCVFKDNEKREKAEQTISALVEGSLESFGVGSEFLTKAEKDEFEKANETKDKDGNVVKVEAPQTSAIAKELVSKSFKLLGVSEDGSCVRVTRDLSVLGKCQRTAKTKMSEFAAEAERQVRGFSASQLDGKDLQQPPVPVLTVSDIIKTNKGDLPILVEFPTDAVIPVCAPGDVQSHIGYFVLIDEYGQPARGQYAWTQGMPEDITTRLATNAARSVFGNQMVNAFQMNGMTQEEVLRQMNQVFSVAVNYLLKSKLNRDGLTGLNINIHEAVGKSLFFNLLAKNKIRMVFVPEPMMIYYRFDHRDNGTGKSFLEDISFMLAFRCTLLVAKFMAAIDNATKHRRIEVNVDDKNVNPLETLESVRNMYLAKKAPNITNDPKTAAESILNQHISIVPKGMVGTQEDLNITHDSHYGNSTAPDSDLLDTVNNMIGIGLQVPPTVLNNLNEAEYARSVATSNLFFANNVRTWQTVIHPENKKFLVNYILSCDQLMQEIRKIIKEDLDGNQSKEVKDNTSACIKDSQDKTAEEYLKRIIASVELKLPVPQMSTTKAHFEEINSQADATQKVLDLIYPDDVAPHDELKSYMSSLRAIAASKLLKEFLPRLGVNKIADIPAIDEIDSDESAKILMFLNNLKRKLDNLVKLGQGNIPPTAEGGEDTGGGESAGSEESTPTEEGGAEEGGGDNDMAELKFD